MQTPQTPKDVQSIKPPHSTQKRFKQSLPSDRKLRGTTRIEKLWLFQKFLFNDTYVEKKKRQFEGSFRIAFTADVTFK